MIACLQARGYDQLFDMSGSEKRNKYLEGTGALVPDRVNGIVYVNLSERADEALAQQWADQLGYKEVVSFRSANLPHRVLHMWYLAHRSSICESMALFSALSQNAHYSYISAASCCHKGYLSNCRHSETGVRLGRAAAVVLFVLISQLGCQSCVSIHIASLAQHSSRMRFSKTTSTLMLLSRCVLDVRHVHSCRTHDKRQKAVYHTNVMLCVGTDVSIVCAEGVTDAKERQRLLASLKSHQAVSLPYLLPHLCLD